MSALRLGHVIVLASVAAFIEGTYHVDTRVAFPSGGGSCVSGGDSTYEADFQTIEIRRVVYARYKVKDLSCISGSQSEVLGATNVLHCASEAQKKKYNTFVFLNNKCTGYTYHAQSCQANPPPKNKESDYFIYMATRPLQKYGPAILNLRWDAGGKGKVAASFELEALCDIRNVRVTLVNGTCKYFKPQPSMCVSLPVEEPTCDGQDLTVELLYYSNKVVATKTLVRDVCKSGTDMCNGCVSSRADERVTFDTLRGDCISRSIPTVTNHEDHENLINIAEMNLLTPFWLDFTRQEDGQFRWPDNTTDLTEFPNAAEFNPQPTENCAAADVDVDTMRLKIIPQSCSNYQYGFCFS